MPLPRRHAVRRPLALATSAAAALLLLPAAPAHAAKDASLMTRWSSTTELSKGARDAVTVTSGEVRLAKPTQRLSYDDPHTSGAAKTYEYGSWTSPWATTGFAAKALVPSWNATTPRGSWIRVEARVRSGATVGSWDTVAAWAFSASDVRRTSATSQTDDLARMEVDTLRATRAAGFDGYQLRVTLLRTPGSSAVPSLQSVGAIASTFTTRSVATSRTTMTRTTELKVPRYSQMIHRGHYPQYGNGGEAWCSPTSTTMVLRSYGNRPGTADTAGIPGPDPYVDHAATYTYDHRYGGTGNWPFNTAYAGRFGYDAFVTRLANLRDVEAFVRAGIPVVTSLAWSRGGLTGAPISSTPGHLMVVVGFTSTGKVIVNDPAAPTNASVRRVYDRAQFERAWLGGSGAISYVIRPTTKALPPDTARW
jgi:hypothetical protein